MTTYATGNPVPSTAIKDLYDNSENLDSAINGAALTWTDRLGVVRRSWARLEADFEQFIADNGLKRYASWALLSADTTRDVGFAADIVGDTGTHTDSVSGLTVSNSGQYRWTGSAWQWLRGDTLSEKADKSEVESVKSDLDNRIESGVKLTYSSTATYAIKITDQYGRHTGGWKWDGTFAPLKIELPERATASDDPSVPLLSRVLPAPLGGLFAEIDASRGIAFQIRDASGRVKFRVPYDGPIFGRVTRAVLAESVAAGSIGPSAFADDVMDTLDAYNNWALQVTGTAPNRALYLINRATNGRSLVANAGDPHAAAIRSGSIIWDSDSGEMYRPLAGGESWPVHPPQDELALFGDSITIGEADRLQALLSGVTVQNRGLAGATVTDIAFRAGALECTAGAVGGTIPASGSVQLQNVTPSGFRYATDSAVTFTWSPVTLAGVPGELSHVLATNVFTFTRSEAGDPVACPDGSPLLSQMGVDYRGLRQMIMMGRNDVTSSNFHDLLIARATTMLDYMTPMAAQRVLMSVTNGTAEGSGTTNYTKIVEGNAKLAALAAEKNAAYFDLRTAFIHEGPDIALANGWISSITSDDLAAQAADRPVPSLMSDTIHPNAAGYNVTAYLRKRFLDNMGWYL